MRAILYNIDVEHFELIWGMLNDLENECENGGVHDCRPIPLKMGDIFC